MPVLTREREVVWRINFGGHSKETSFIIEEPVYERKSEPDHTPSKTLSQETGLDVIIRDWSATDCHTHKGQLTKLIVEAAKRQNRRIIFAINPYPSTDLDSNGSFDDALALDTALYFPESQHISIIPSHTPYANVEPIHPQFPNSRQRVDIGIPLDDFVDSRSLKEFFYLAMLGESVPNHPLNAWFTSPQLKKVNRFLKSRGINPYNVEHYVDVTNVPSSITYPSDTPLQDHLIEYLIAKPKGTKCYIVGSIGTGKNFLSLMENADGKDIKLIGVVPRGHALDPKNEYDETLNIRLNTAYIVDSLKKVIREASKRDNVYLKFIDQKEIGQAKRRLDYVIAKEHPHIRTSATGAAGFSVLKSKKDSSEQAYFTPAGIIVPHTYRIAQQDGRYRTIRSPVTLQYGSPTLITNTGKSDYFLLMQLIEKRIVK